MGSRSHRAAHILMLTCSQIFFKQCIMVKGHCFIYFTALREKQAGEKEHEAAGNLGAVTCTDVRNNSC